MNPQRNKFLEKLINQLNKKKSGLEEKIAQAKKRMSEAEGPMQSWSDHTQADIEEEIAILIQQHKTIESQIKEIKGLFQQKIPSGEAALGSIVAVEIDGERDTFFLINSQIANFEQGLLSIQSPLGKTLVGKKEGQNFALPAPTAPLKVKVLKVN